MNSRSLFVALIFFRSLAVAGTGIEAGSTPTATTTSPAVNQSANQSSSGNGFAQAVNYVAGGSEVVMGGYMIKTGSATPTNPSLIAMGVMMVSMGLANIAQGSDHGGAASSADTTGFQTDGFGSLSSTGTSAADPYVTAAVSDPNFQAVASTLKSIEAAGVYNPKTGAFTVGDKTYSSADLSSAASMASAGLPKGAIDGALAANAEAEKKALAKLEKVKATKENGYEEGGGSGGGSAVATASDEEGSSAQDSSGKMQRSISAETSAASVAGLSKNFNGEAIGVAGDNIFSMVSRRYKLKDSQEAFLKP